MPTSTQYETVKQQCLSFKNMGFPVTFKIQQLDFNNLKMDELKYGPAPSVKIDAFFKRWNFCDPDWDIVIKQLACLYKHLTRDLNKNDKNTTM